MGLGVSSAGRHPPRHAENRSLLPCVVWSRKGFGDSVHLGAGQEGYQHSLGKGHGSPKHTQDPYRQFGSVLTGGEQSVMLHKDVQVK